MKIGRSLLYAGEHGVHIHDLAYTQEADSFDAPIVTHGSEHLFRGVNKQMNWSPGPDYAATIVNEDGSLVHMAYDKSQEVLAPTPIRLGGNDVRVLTAASIPDSYVDGAGNVSYRHHTYVTVERTIKWFAAAVC